MGFLKGSVGSRFLTRGGITEGFLRAARLLDPGARAAGVLLSECSVSGVFDKRVGRLNCPHVSQAVGLDSRQGRCVHEGVGTGICSGMILCTPA